MTDSRNDEVVALQILAILDDDEAKGAIKRASAAAGDVVSFCETLENGLDHAQAELPDVVFLEVSLSESAGVALVHHLKAVNPKLRVFVLVQPERLELGAQAMSLGASGIVMMPPSGDELLSALSDTRARVGADAVRARLERESGRANMRSNVAGALARLGAAATRREVADRITDVLLDHTGADTVAVYVPAGERSRDLLRLSQRGLAEPPAMGDEMALHRFAADHGLFTQKLEIGNETTGILMLGGLECYGRSRGELMELVSSQGAAALALITAREQAQRGAMKDPGSSAYTFAYFVDVAGREIDKARRHGRRFALLTLTLEDEAAPESASVELAERVLATVRATDVLARVDEREFYLLLPETGGLGVHTARRRLQSRLAGVRGGRRGEGEPLGVAIGTAVYPHDGSALSALLRMAKRRAEASSNSLVSALDSDIRPLDEVLEALFWGVAEQGEAVDPDRLRTIELPLMDLVSLASAALSEAVRGGAARIVASQGPGLGVGAAVRSAPGADRGEVEITVTEATNLDGGRDIEALAIVAEHGTYALLVDASAVWCARCTPRIRCSRTWSWISVTGKRPGSPRWEWSPDVALPSAGGLRSGRPRRPGFSAARAGACGHRGRWSGGRHRASAELFAGRLGLAEGLAARLDKEQLGGVPCFVLAADGQVGRAAIACSNRDADVIARRLLALPPKRRAGGHGTWGFSRGFAPGQRGGSAPAVGHESPHGLALLLHAERRGRGAADRRRDSRRGIPATWKARRPSCACWQRPRAPSRSAPRRRHPCVASKRR